MHPYWDHLLQMWRTRTSTTVLSSRSGRGSGTLWGSADSGPWGHIILERISHRGPIGCIWMVIIPYRQTQVQTRSLENQSLFSGFRCSACSAIVSLGLLGVSGRIEFQSVGKDESFVGMFIGMFIELRMNTCYGMFI